MRREKKELINKYLEELKTIKREIKEPKVRFLNTVPDLYTLNNGRSIPREQILKNGIDGSAVIVAPYLEDTKEFLVAFVIA